jgi:hypothetical protein
LAEEQHFELGDIQFYEYVDDFKERQMMLLMTYVLGSRQL